jgi:Zn-dependent protease
MAFPASLGGGGLSFSVAGIPVRIELTFFLFIFFITSRAGDLTVSLLWGGVILASVLAHEFGHAIAFRRFGIAPSISVHGLGGATTGRGDLTTARSVIVSLAGPFAGVLLGLAVLGVDNAGLLADTDTVRGVVAAMLWVNLGWGLVNLLPMVPLDGGHVVQAIAVGRWNKAGMRFTYVVSLITAAVAAVIAWRFGYLFALLLVGFFAFQSVRGLMDLSKPDARELVERGFAALNQQDYPQAISDLEAAKRHNLLPEARELVDRGLAHAYQAMGRPVQPSYGTHPGEPPYSGPGATPTDT